MYENFGNINIFASKIDYYEPKKEKNNIVNIRFAALYGSFCGI
jgi:hypothetical protein